MRNKAGKSNLPAFSLHCVDMLQGRKLFLLVLGVLAFGFTVYCYWPGALYFQNDDFTHILLSSKNVLFQRNSFRPVCDLSVMLDYRIWGNNAAGYHFTNLVLHIICTLLLFSFCKKLCNLYYPAMRGKPFPFIVALLFFIYPLHSEAVFWILGRSATLGTIFSLLFLNCFIRELFTPANVLGCIVFYAIALLTYESTWALLPVSMVLCASLPGGLRPVVQRKWHFIMLAIIFCVYLFARWKVNHELVGIYEGEYFLDGNIVALAFHFSQLLARSFVPYLEAPIVIMAGFGLLLVLLAYRFFRVPKTLMGKPLLIAACSIICLLPCLSVGIDTHGTASERFLYLPSVFVCMLIAMLLCISANNKLPNAVLILIVVVFAAQLFINAGNYRLAGAVVKQTVQEIEANPGRPIIIDSLPRAQHGALILTDGLPDAVQLLGRDSGTVNIHSKRDELRPLVKPYKTVYMPVSEDSVVRFVYSDTALIIYR